MNTPQTDTQSHTHTHTHIKVNMCNKHTHSLEYYMVLNVFQWFHNHVLPQLEFCQTSNQEQGLCQSQHTMQRSISLGSWQAGGLSHCEEHYVQSHTVNTHNHRYPLSMLTHTHTQFADRHINTHTNSCTFSLPVLFLSQTHTDTPLFKIVGQETPQLFWKTFKSYLHLEYVKNSKKSAQRHTGVGKSFCYITLTLFILEN